MDIIDTFANRFATALNLRRMKQSEIVYQTGIGKSSISMYLSGCCRPKQTYLYLIAKALDVSEAWLMGYDVPMERNPSVTAKQDDASAPKRLGRLTDNEIYLVEAYRALDDWGRGSVDATLQREYERVRQSILPQSANRKNHA